MKKLFTVLLFMVFSQITFSQSQLWNNFYKDDVLLKLYWQQVVNTDLTLEELVFEVKASGNFDQVEVFDTRIIAHIRPFEVNYMNSGYSTTLIPDFLMSGYLSGMAIFEYKENHYRATVRNVLRHYNLTEYYINEQVSTPIEERVMNRKNELKEETFMIVTNILNQEFQNRMILNRPYDVW